MIEVGIKDIIDIVLVALLLFYIYKLMRESSSANIFGGVLIFVLVWIFVSKVFEMRLLGGIFDTLINVGSLALIILFQEEIRQFFSSIGTQRASRVFHWLHRHREGNIHREDIMPIVMACMSMGKQKIGALIVVERDMNLNDISKTGEIIDAAISQRLIENIFFKNSPLHDGAMVVSKKRIKAAGCILPVSHDNEIPRSAPSCGLGHFSKMRLHGHHRERRNGRHLHCSKWAICPQTFGRATGKPAHGPHGANGLVSKGILRPIFLPICQELCIFAVIL